MDFLPPGHSDADSVFAAPATIKNPAISPRQGPVAYGVLRDTFAFITSTSSCLSSGFKDCRNLPSI